MSKFEFIGATGAIGALITTALGGWDAGLVTLVILMAIDFVSGLAIAFVWKRSPKTENGAASSEAGFQGLIKKGMMLLMVLVAVRLDLMIGVNYIRDAVVIALTVNELISLVENWGLMGLPVPAPLKKAIELLKSKEDKKP